MKVACRWPLPAFCIPKHSYIASRHLLAFVSSSLMWVGMTVSVSAAPFQALQPLPKQPPIPKDNPMSRAKVALGQQLFFDPRLSVTGTHSCNTCHNVMAGGEDGRAVSIGVNGVVGTRGAPTVWNAAFNTVLYRDGRAASLEEQVKTHLLSATEMGMPNEQAVVARIAAIPGYVSQFARIFGSGSAKGFDATDAVNYTNIAKAIATYERTLVTPDSAYDRYLRGDKRAISAQARRGLDEFQKVQCVSCHFWVNMAGPVPGLAFQMGEGFYELFPNYKGSVYEQQYQLADDIGRYNVTGIEGDRHMWRVMSLRNVAVTAPYFHNGTVKKLDEAVRVMGKTQLNVDLTDQQVQDITVFLNTLTGKFPEQKMPRLPLTSNSSAIDSPLQ